MGETGKVRLAHAEGGQACRLLVEPNKAAVGFVRGGELMRAQAGPTYAHHHRSSRELAQTRDWAYLIRSRKT